MCHLLKSGISVNDLCPTYWQSFSKMAFFVVGVMFKIGINLRGGDESS